MAKLRMDEIRPGLVVYQEPSVLVLDDNCLTNAVEERLVYRKGPFVVLERYDDTRWLCVPTFTAVAGNNDRIALDTNLKAGHANWTGVDCYFSKFQFWAIPDECMVKASDGVEFSWQDRRNSYADSAPSELDRIAQHKGDSEEVYRHVARLPIRP